jgi:hypothetical protein
MKTTCSRCRKRPPRYTTLKHGRRSKPRRRRDHDLCAQCFRSDGDRLHAFILVNGASA